MTTLILVAVLEKLNQLDEQAAFRAANAASLKRSRSRGGVAMLPPETGATGMQVDIKTPAIREVGPVKIPDNIRNSFRRYSELIEGAENPMDRSIRSQLVLDDLNQRTTPEITAAAFAALQEFLKEREPALPRKTIKAPDDVPVAGDVD